jgi:acyl-coenzyme A thioesterase PaaI-like protein
MEAIVDEDVVAEGWVVRRGRRVVFGQAEARAARSGRLVATAVLTYNVSPPPPAG